MAEQYRIENSGSPDPELYLYGDIGAGWFGDGITADRVIKDLNALGKKKTIVVRIDSPGGNVFDGLNIYNALVRNPATIRVEIDAMAASIASIIAMSGRTIRMADNAMMMVHEPWTGVVGTSADLRKQADVLDKTRDNLVRIYADRSGLPQDKASDMMRAETWMNAPEALAAGLINEITPNLAIAASVYRANLPRYGYRNLPRFLLTPRETPRLDAFRAKAGRLYRLAVPVS
jgi:ATP-dependent Clp protease protease subunit